MDDISISFKGSDSDHTYELFFTWFYEFGKEAFIEYCAQSGIQITDISGSDFQINIVSGENVVAETRH